MIPVPKTGLKTQFGVRIRQSIWKDFPSLSREILELRKVSIDNKLLFGYVVAVKSSITQNMIKIRTESAMIGRTEEQKMLQSLLEEEEPQFVAVYGRRRIGKTYLIRESFHYSFTFQHTGISNNSLTPGDRMQAQLDKFAESLSEAGFQPTGKLRTWNDAFNALKQVIIHSQEKKKVIFIDELSWMDTRQSGLISALESSSNTQNRNIAILSFFHVEGHIPEKISRPGFVVFLSKT